MIGCMLHNTATDRWHPIFFRPAPMPSGTDTDRKMMRHRSWGHHTDGFATLEEAVADGMAMCTAETGIVWDGTMWTWNGQEKPVLTAWFPLSLTEDIPS